MQITIWILKSRIDLKFLAARNWVSLWETFVYFFESCFQTKSKNNSLSDPLLFYRLWQIRSFINLSLDIIYGFRLDLSKNRLSYTNIQLYFTLFIQKWNDINYLSWNYSPYGESFFEIIPLPVSYAMRIPWNIFYI